ncbi:hypothetical protein [Roseibium aggregatum]|uniref:hypothetical protein n=1 Tax=Roseibium aggregatum TaxID=187304 RepID=UPI001E2FC478|nr:hypothetical protein [Roseibium aggregatum]UES51175.1 hypothetical protein GFK88_17085 [Roseibium aggregatum]
MKPSQLFCNECNHWQNWRKIFGFSSTILSLLVALLGLSIPIMDRISALRQPFDATANIATETTFDGQQWRKTYRLALLNEGKKPLFLTNLVSCRFSTQTNGEPLDLELQFNIQFSSEDMYIVNTHNSFPISALIESSKFRSEGTVSYRSGGKLAKDYMYTLIQSENSKTSTTDCSIRLLYNGKEQKLGIFTDSSFAESVLRLNLKQIISHHAS